MKTIEELGLSVRTYNVLKAKGIRYESEIRQLSLSEISKFSNIRKNCIYELEELLDIKFE